jgi:hypothetical protein
VLAASVGVDRLAERDVGGVVARDDGARVVDADLGRERRQFLVDRAPAVVHALASGGLETAAGVDGRATALARGALRNGELRIGFVVIMHGAILRPPPSQHASP